jgi:hypothetical protein
LQLKFGLFFLLVAVALMGCGTSKDTVIEKLVSKEEGKLKMQIFSTSHEWDFEVNKVLNSEPILLNNINQVEVHAENNKLPWLKALSLEEMRPVVLVFDTKKMVFHTNDPEKLRDFALSLDK